MEKSKKGEGNANKKTLCLKKKKKKPKNKHGQPASLRAWIILGNTSGIWVM